MLTNIYNRPIRIVHIVTQIAPAGKEIGLLKLIESMNPEKFMSQIVVLNRVEFIESVNINRGLIIDLKLGKGNHPGLPVILAKVFRKNKIDVVHTHSWGTLIEGIMGAKIAKVPIIIHGEHGTFPEKFPHRRIQPIFWGMADRVLSVSKLLRNKLSRVTKFPEEKIDVILNGVNSGKFFPSKKLRGQFRKSFNFSAEDFIVGTVGRLTPVKNQAMLIRAAALLYEQKMHIQVVFIGNGELREELANLADSLGISENVHFLGFQENVNLFLNGMDVFTLTSFSEGCSNVLQEAMFVGKGIIATNVGGNPEMIKDRDTGFLVESNNHYQLAERIKKFIFSPQILNEMSGNARKFANTNFSLEKMVSEYENLYLQEMQKKYLNY